MTLDDLLGQVSITGNVTHRMVASVMASPDILKQLVQRYQSDKARGIDSPAVKLFQHVALEIQAREKKKKVEQAVAYISLSNLLSATQMAIVDYIKLFELKHSDKKQMTDAQKYIENMMATLLPISTAKHTRDAIERLKCDYASLLVLVSKYTSMIQQQDVDSFIQDMDAVMERYQPVKVQDDEATPADADEQA